MPRSKVDPKHLHYGFDEPPMVIGAPTNCKIPSHLAVQPTKEMEPKVDTTPKAIATLECIVTPDPTHENDGFDDSPMVIGASTNCKIPSQFAAKPTKGKETNEDITPNDAAGPEGEHSRTFDNADVPAVAGYESVLPCTSSQMGPVAPPFIPPPSYENICAESADASRCDPLFAESTDKLDESAARLALLEYVDSQDCCYGKSAARNMAISKITPSSALHYSLESFTETRTTAWATTPHCDGWTVDGPDSGPAPLPWDIDCAPAFMFCNETRTIEVPHTSYAEGCPTCESAGKVECPWCYGKGKNTCVSCSGLGGLYKLQADGVSGYSTCLFCHGTGNRECLSCDGKGRITCETCAGLKFVRFFISLEIQYINNRNEHVVKRSDMTDGLILAAPGHEVLNHALPRVQPISNHPDQEICETSQRFVEKDLAGFPIAKILMQRQILRVVPVFECAYSWKSKTGRFWVYGTDHRVEAPDYPQTCCWGCTIV